jgi:hypothetical protein
MAAAATLALAGPCSQLQAYLEDHGAEKIDADIPT